MTHTPSLAEFAAAVRYNPETGLFYRMPANIPLQPSTTGYVTIGLRGGYAYAHRLAWALVHGEWPNLGIDHINGDRTDNRISNLREVPQKDNCRNAAKSKSNSSGVSGVYWSKGRNKWVANISVDYRTHYLGIFSDFSEAVKARKRAEAAFGFHPNHGRMAA